MSEELDKMDGLDEPELIELEDEDGNTVTFEFIDSVEHEGAVYYALVPYSEGDDAEEEEFVILKEIALEDEQYQLVTIDDDNEYSSVGELFLKRFQEAFGEEGVDGEFLQ